MHCVDFPLSFLPHFISKENKETKKKTKNPANLAFCFWNNNLFRVRRHWYVTAYRKKLS